MADLLTVIKGVFENKKADIVIGYTKASTEGRTRPIIIRSVEEATGLVVDSSCLNNLSTYLTRRENKGKKVAIVAKGCDIKAIVQLVAESQIKREDVYIIGIRCNGVKKGFEGEDAKHLAEKCLNCNVKTPHLYDELIEMKDESLTG
ncbi:MAG: hypothetical protein ACPL7I_06135, partial [Myxococcota bacterium]